MCVVSVLPGTRDVRLEGSGCVYQILETGLVSRANAVRRIATNASVGFRIYASGLKATASLAVGHPIPQTASRLLIELLSSFAPRKKRPLSQLLRSKRRLSLALLNSINSLQADITPRQLSLAALALLALAPQHERGLNCFGNRS